MWSPPTLCELYGQPKVKIEEWIQSFFGIFGDYPGFMLGYTDNEPSIPFWGVQVYCGENQIHGSNASGEKDARLLADYYLEAAHNIQRILGWESEVITSKVVRCPSSKEEEFLDSFKLTIRSKPSNEDEDLSDSFKFTKRL